MTMAILDGWMRPTPTWAPPEGLPWEQRAQLTLARMYA